LLPGVWTVLAILVVLVLGYFAMRSPRSLEWALAYLRDIWPILLVLVTLIVVLLWRRSRRNTLVHDEEEEKESTRAP
jgi:type VI protein secretion system component VasK